MPYGGAFHIMAIPFVLVLGVILGSIIGCMMWIIRAKAGINLSAIVRAIMGAGFLLLLSTLRNLIAGEENSGLIPPTPLELLINGAMFFTFFGALPAILARPSGETLQSPKLTDWRNRELNYGLATSLVAICLSALVLTSPTMEKTFGSIWDRFIAIIFFNIPGLLVGFGSYVHAAKRQAWGQAMLLTGCVFVVATSLFLFVILPLYRISAWPVLNLSFAFLASLTLLFSVLARKE